MGKSKVLVTGGSGFLGLEVCRQGAKLGHEIISLQRNQSDELSKLGLQQELCSLTDRDHLTEVFDRVRPHFVIHCAAKAGVWGPYADFESANVIGSLNLADVAEKASVSRMIYTSTPSVVFRPEGILCGTEDLPYTQTKLAAYPLTKAIAEKALLDRNKATFKVSSIRPPFIWGAGDPHFYPRLLRTARKGRLPLIGNGQNRVNVCYVKNAAAAHWQLLDFLESDPGGKAYFIGEGPVEIEWFFRRLLGYRGDLRSIHLPFWPVYYMAAVLETIQHLLGKQNTPPAMTRFAALALSKTRTFSTKRAHLDFYRPPFTIDKALQEFSSLS